MQKSICHITTVHPRYDGRVFEKECISLVREGFAVYLIVADGKNNEVVDGVNIIDVGKSRFGRFGRLFFGSIGSLVCAIRIKADIYHFHDPELIPSGLILKVIGRKVVYDIHENLPLQILHKHWIPKYFRTFFSKIFSTIEFVFCRYFDSLVVPQPSMKTSYCSINPNTELVANFVDISRINEDFTINDNKPLAVKRLVHLGALTEERGIFNMLNVMSELDSSYSLTLAGVINNPKTKEKSEVHKSWDKVSYKGILTKEEVEVIYSESNLGLILYNNVGQYYLSYAIKLFEFMSKGIPVIMPNFGEWPKFNEQYQVGICVDVSNPKEIAQRIEQLLCDPVRMNRYSVNGINAIKNKFNWDLEVKKLVEVYRGILNEN
ncbi:MULTISPECIES: glycosyltransferase [unclassified Shewanella]|uniref:glycosyltransferase n=1 Tax=unclassified Shewanella TaxID=196818 RepID=UPI0039B3FF75